MGCSVWLKLENVQTSGSFKTRGLGRLFQKASQLARLELVVEVANTVHVVVEITAPWPFDLNLSTTWSERSRFTVNSKFYLGSKMCTKQDSNFFWC